MKLVERQTRYGAGFDLASAIDNLPPGLERALLRVLSSRVGRECAISRRDLVRQLEGLGFKVHERMARACINQLRKAGQPICSTGGEDGGYWMASGWDELDEYIQREIHSRAMDLLEQEKALRKEGEKRWGVYSKQFGLGI